MEEMRNVYNILVGNPEEKRLRERPREIGWEGVDWRHVALDRDQWRTRVNTVMNFRVP
jgi:hypothetical protein